MVFSIESVGSVYGHSMQDSRVEGACCSNTRQYNTTIKMMLVSVGIVAVLIAGLTTS